MQLALAALLTISAPADAWWCAANGGHEAAPDADRRCPQHGYRMRPLARGDELDLPAWPKPLEVDVRPDGWTCTSPATSAAMHARLELLDRMPGLCRTVGDSRVREATAIQSELHKVDIAYHVTRIEQLERERWTPLQRAGAVLGGAAVGAGVTAIVLLLMGAAR